MKKPNFLAPYQIWWYEVPNDSSLDVINSKIRPILILETYVDEEEIKSGEVDLNYIYPDYVIGTTKTKKYFSEPNAFKVDTPEEIKAFFLHAPTVFRFDKLESRHADISYSDILNNGSYAGTLSKKYQKILRDTIRLKKFKLPPIQENLVTILEESNEEEFDSEGNKLSEEQINFFKHSKARDSKGRLLVCYHGTPSPGFLEFSPSNKNKSQFGEYKFNTSNVNYFTSNINIAKGYTELGVGDLSDSADGRYKNIYKCYLNIEKPYIVNNSTKAEIKSWKNIQDKYIREIQKKEFERIFNKWESLYPDSSDINKINNDLFTFGYRIDLVDEDENVVDLVKLPSNSLFGSERVVMKEYTLTDLFDITEYGNEFKENILGDISDTTEDTDYFFDTDTIVKWVLFLNETRNTNYDGVIVSDILDIGPRGSMFNSQGTDLVTLKSANQIKLISNLFPTNSSKINESENSNLNNSERDSEGNLLSSQQVQFFKNSSIRNSRGELLVMYHGAINDFKDKTFKATINWFSQSKKYAESFSNWSDLKGTLYKCYLNCDNPLYIGNTSVPCYLPYPIKPYKFSSSAISLIHKLKLSETEARNLFNSIAEEYDEPYNGFKMHLHVVTRSNSFAKLVKDLGYDCIITIEDGALCVGVFYPKSIKLISNDNPTNSIYFSK